jgi:hypothetical protein
MDNHLKKNLQEKIELDINIGDEILAGRFKNKKVIVKDIGKDDKNQPTINGKTILKFRIKKLIKEEIDKLFESIGFESDAAQQIATNMALFKLPRKGMDDSINYFDQLQFQLNKENPEEEDIDNQFDLPTPNIPAATTTTNIYEEKKIKENFNDNNIYDGTTAAMKNLDWERPVSPQTGSFSKEAQEEFDLHNDNINRALKEVPVGNSREGGMSNNKSKNF